ncbi:mechanosensitive ion channel family protein [Catenovulum maritimum]|uniref:mechanosensitive ion channel family protein n=1 Tax=Catenovulum maritimum TaxID=1513271 RepID=UPI0006609265|nr:mechanosensitive ion channel domain-containing protein [Catenovulum maritimum]
MIEDIEKYSEQIFTYVVEYGSQALLALVVLIIGLWIINRISASAHKALLKSAVDDTLSTFLSGAVDIILKVLLVISVASMVGIETTSFIAILGAAGLAVGMALQGSLSNFAGGVMLLIFRPVRVGDYINAQGQSGTVVEMGIFVTVLETFDKQIIIIPNGPLSNGNVINYSKSPTRAVEVTFSISYSDNMKVARDTLTQLMQQDERVLKDADNVVAVVELGDSSVNILYRAFVKTEDYWGYFFDIHEEGKLALENAGCSIPFPQTDVHLYKEQA